MTPEAEPPPPNVPSPAATGQAGGAFEQHVDALSLSLLLVRGVPPVLKDAVVEEVHLQTAHAGWATDDILVLGRSGDGQISKLALQVKRSLTISSADKDCVETVSGFWNDFHEASRFNKDRDRLAVVVLHGTQTLMQNLVPLLDCARASRDAADFQGRLKAKGYLSRKAHAYYDSIREICEGTNGSTVTDADLWEFLKALHVLAYDLATATAQTEALLLTMLSATAVGHDRKTVSSATWHHLVKLAVESMGVAKSFRREDLPGSLLSAHTPVCSGQHEALSTLTSHGRTVLRGIKDSVAGSVRLDRKTIETQVAGAIAGSRVVIVSGPAGVGKSAVAKRVVERLSQDQFVFSFRAEEFATAHLDTTLRDAGVNIPAEELLGLLAAQGRKLIHVESVERLLEHATRNAFSDLLQLLADKELSLVLTCRSYSLEIVRTSLIAPLGIPCEVIIIPELDDSELDEVSERFPPLKRPAGSPALKKLFRNAYLLDKAAMMDWPDGGTLPEDERSFRKKFWSEVVRKDSETADGLPQRRERAFQEIALRRARALTPFAACGDLDAAVVDLLRRDDLILHPEETITLASTAHDVLEDWALIGWIDEQFRASQGDYDRFLSALDASPAIRRAYRRWLQEMLECKASDSDLFIEHVLRSKTVTSQLRDDTCVSTLLSTSAPEFLARKEDLLLADDCELLVQMIHLLRIACVKIPSWANKSALSSFFVPSGAAWQAILEVVRKHIDKLLPQSRLLVLGLIDDFGKGVAWWVPYPKGSIAAAEIAHSLLPYFEDYDSEEQKKSTLEVIAKIPLASPKKFLELVELAKGTREERRSVEEFVEIVLEGTSSLPAARDFPDEVISLAEARMLLREADLRVSRRFGDALGVDTSFGISHRLQSDFFPASAYRGIFLPLLRSQREKGVEFLLRLFNQIADWYTNPRYGNRLEEAYEIELTLADSSKVTQWCNGRFWRLYRGTSTGPYVLQTALMALELFLEEIADSDPNSFEPLLDSLLRGSRNASISAVVASVATAHPKLSGLTGAALLTSRDFVVEDKIRRVAEHEAVVISSGLLGRSDQKVYDDERKAANALPHRQWELEIMAINLQLGGFAERVQEIIDVHKKALPEPSEQTTEDRQWRLALHRMDLRGLAPREIMIEGTGESGTSPEKVFALEPQGIEPDIQEMIDEGAPGHQRFNDDAGLFNWAFKKFRREIIEEPSDKTWEKRLLQAKACIEKPLEEEDQSRLSYNAPRYAAAACVRHHWDAMTPEERKWCLNLLVEAIELDADDSGDFALMSKNPMDPSRPAAYCMPLLLGKELSPELSALAMRGLATALTHSNKEVITLAAEGVGYYLWSEDRDLAVFLTAVMARRANEIDRLLKEDRTTEFTGRSGYFPIVLQVNGQIRKLIEERGEVSLDEITKLNIRGEQTRFDIDVPLSLLRNPGDDPIPRQIFEKAISALIHWWKRDRRTRPESDRVPHEQLSTIIERTSRYALQLPTDEALKLCEPILASVDDNYQEVAKFVQNLITAEDQMHTGENFWALWLEVANRLKGASWMKHLDSDYPGYDSLISAVFFGPPCSRERFHWTPLDGNAHRVHELALALPTHHRVLDEYVLFLYYLGEKSLPLAFLHVAAIVGRGDPKALLSQSNTVFCLDRMLQQYVYGSPRTLKQNAPLREAVMQLLDALVEAGSSAAYRMRDDFVTPLAG